MSTIMTSNYELVAFDVDGTLVGSRDGRVVWQFLNTHYGGADAENARRFRAYLDGEITYTEWVDLDIGQWVTAGATRDDMAAVIRDRLYLTTGAREAVHELRQRGYKLAIISGTLDITLDLLFPAHPFEQVHTNKIWFDERGLIAGWEATHYDMAGKAHALEELATRLGVPLERTVFVGDNINDIYVMQAAGLAVAFEPKDPSVSAVADAVVQADMRQLLDLLPPR
jgi:phosphoserine phosphatase